MTFEFMGPCCNYKIMGIDLTGGQVSQLHCGAEMSKPLECKRVVRKHGFSLAHWILRGSHDGGFTGDQLQIPVQIQFCAGTLSCSLGFALRDSTGNPWLLSRGVSAAVSQ
ncbi:hypothetical protein LB503_010617 [Fusarium chuoi]|nr:hypothetical protein LB503_010617 [Fusarium chuoi]